MGGLIASPLCIDTWLGLGGGGCRTLPPPLSLLSLQARKALHSSDMGLSCGGGGVSGCVSKLSMLSGVLGVSVLSCGSLA